MTTGESAQIVAGVKPEVERDLISERTREGLAKASEIVALAFCGAPVRDRRPDLGRHHDDSAGPGAALISRPSGATRTR